VNLPETAYPAPFHLTRASHIVLTVNDLAASRAFYVDLLGFVVSDEDADAIYLRGLAEACHHSVVLERSAGAPACRRIGMRVFTEDDLEKAKATFEAAGLPAAWVERPYQGRTLEVSDAVGVPLELCAVMPTCPRLLLEFEAHHAACPQRLDHFQILLPEVRQAFEFYAGLGFRLSEYVAPDGTDELLMVFLQRKGNPHDIVFAAGAGPRLHHTAFSIPESYHFFYVCDLAARLGFAENVEWGPGRHGPGNALFLYLRDPDGHRVELFNSHYLTVDIEDEPVRWDTSRASARRWQLPARRDWFVDGSPFEGVDVREPERAAQPLTLEDYVAPG
jgi:catechol 2,3-dioxygenase